MGGAGRTHGPGQGRGGRKLTGGPRSVQRDLMDGVSGEKSAQVGGGDIDEAAAGGIGGPGEVGGDEAARGGEEGIVGRGRFGGEHVDGGAGDGVVPEGLGKISFVDEGASRGIDQDCGRLHLGETGGIDQSGRGGGEGAVKAVDVAFGEQAIQRGVLNAFWRRG